MEEVAAQRVSTAEITELGRILPKGLDAADDRRGLNQINWEFRKAIYSAAHNRSFLRSIAAIFDEIALLKGMKYIPEGSAAELH